MLSYLHVKMPPATPAMIAVKVVRITPTLPELKPMAVKRTIVNKKANTEIRAVATYCRNLLPFNATKAPPMMKIMPRTHGC